MGTVRSEPTFHPLTTATRENVLMAHASVRGWRPGLALGFGMLLAAGIGLALVPGSSAQSKDPPKPSSEKPADKEKPAEPGKHEETPRHENHVAGNGIKDPRDLEVIKLIDEK